MSDDELDKLFKEAADGFKAPKDSSAWHDMLRRLDKRPIPSGFWNWKTISTAAFIGITGIGLVWYTVQENSREHQTQEVPQSTNSLEVEKKNQLLGEVTSEPSTEISSDIKSIVSTQRNSTSSTSKVTVNATNNQTLPITSTTTDFNPSTVQNASSLKHDVIEEENNKGAEYAIITVDASITMSNSTEVVQNQEANKSASGLSKSTTDSDSVALDSAVVEQKMPNDSAQVIAKKEEQKDDIRRSGSSLSIKLTVAPDFSSVNYYTPDKSGFNYGVLLGYSFNNRWSVYSGAIYSKKIYSSDEIDEPYTTSGGYDYDVTELKGDCRVIDIPINFYYTFFPERSFSIKAGLGFTSYIMLQEDYIYYVDNPYGTNQYEQNVEHENNEWFKMLNVSVMLQKKLSNRFYLEFEPFLKAPLAGVGEGEVSLVSMGAFFNLRFDIPMTHKP